MKTLYQLSSDSLESTVCPSCQQEKAVDRSFCYRCFKLIPPAVQIKLYRRNQDTYPQSWWEALEWLKERKLDKNSD